MLWLKPVAAALGRVGRHGTLLGLDIALTLTSLVIGMCVAPLTSAFFTHLFLGSALISPVSFGFILVLIIGGSAATAAIVRAFALGSIGLTALLFLKAGPARALAIGLLTGSRNISLMLTALGFAVPDVSWLYFALAQLPIYLLPHLLKPLARRLASTPAALRRPGAA